MKFCKFPHVPRPLVSEQSPHYLIGNALNLFVQPPGAKIQKMAHEQRDVLGAFSQGREAQREHVEPIIKIAPELPPLHHLRQVPAGGCDNARICPNGLGAAKPFEFLFLEHS